MTMKIAFISDIHGNATALEAVLAHIREQAVDRIYVLGDLCYRCRPRNVPWSSCRLYKRASSRGMRTSGSCVE
ncbi:metallophosphoesterase family protein [Paenibacillus sp. TAB 01]|uniref:metallophosphoesterase family protein n=1 Tax=Paenibacillus sp. TAB 01 TaxID=3368988 RepID=UPI00374FDCDC